MKTLSTPSDKPGAKADGQLVLLPCRRPSLMACIWLDLSRHVWSGSQPRQKRALICIQCMSRRIQRRQRPPSSNGWCEPKSARGS